MIKLKVIKLFNYEPVFDMYIVDFVREAEIKRLDEGI